MGAAGGAGGSAAPGDGRLSWVQRIAFGGADLGKNMFWSSMTMFWLFFLTDVLEIPPATAGLIFLIPLVWDGITDPAMGYIADRTYTRWGKYRPYLLFGAPVCALTFLLVFFKPPLGPTGTVYFALAAGLLFRTAYTVIDTPHNALMARATSSSHERSLLAGSRMFFAAMAALVISLAVYPVLMGEGAAEEAERFLVFAAAGGAVCVTMVWFCFFAFRGTDVARRGDPNQPPPPSIGDIAHMLASNHMLWIVFAATAVGVMLLPLFGKTLIYFAKYNLGDDKWASVGLTAFSLGAALSIPAWVLLSHRIGKSRALQASAALTVLMLLIFYFNPSTDRTLLMSLLLVQGFLGGGFNVLVWAMAPDLVEYGEWKTGKRVEAGVFGFFTLSVKVAVGVGGSLLGFLLGAIGFVANRPQSPEVLANIKLIMCAVPIAGAAIVFVLLFFYKLDHAMHRRITEELAARRK
ncbi:MAG: MFS transporter [Alphaproteobacteria bacterium]|nr:MFS transporter [Alphaproteobacteria bacterium]